MAATKRFFSRVATPIDENAERVSVHYGDLLERILLFDQYILESIRLKEIPELVKLFGHGPTIELLRSEALKINCQIVSIDIGETGHPLVQKSREKKGEPPLFGYSISLLQASEPDKMLSRFMKEFHDIPGLSLKQIKGLKRAVVENLVLIDDKYQTKMLSSSVEDFRRNDPSLKTAVCAVIKNDHNIEINRDKLWVQTDFINQSDLIVSNNLVEAFGFQKDEAREILKKGLFGIIERNRRLVEMEALKTMVGFKESELALVDDKFRYLIKNINDQSVSDKFRKIIEIKQFPDFSEAATAGIVDLSKLLEIREDAECIEFRQWLFDLDEIDTKELNERLNSFSSKLQSFYNRGSTKTIKWLSLNVLGQIPFASLVSSGLGFLDEFVIGQKLKPDNIVTFINDRLPSVFRK